MIQVAYLPPFSSVDSLGESVAKTVIEARETWSVLIERRCD